jgi:hypothetical protein
MAIKNSDVIAQAMVRLLCARPEWAPWANNWLVRAEYLNYNFGGVWVAPFSTSDLIINEVRAGLAYKF